jgi:hypothetical protein
MLDSLYIAAATYCHHIVYEHINDLAMQWWLQKPVCS